MKRFTLCCSGDAHHPVAVIHQLELVLALCALLGGCSARTQQPAQQATPSSASTVDPAADADAGIDPVAAPAVARADCSDGTCFPCGEGECPLGAYCDRDGPVGPACAWLSECPGKASCGCIQRVLGPSCQCESADGPSVTCAH